ncbi:MAG: hypothetical protein IJ802_01160 [Kiritimatiellae bacterium]|nr:hypothetical protein [Kiritimatiellia bacterium]
MIDDVYEPLARYRDEFKAKFDALAKEKFAELTVRSGVDVERLREIAGKVHGMERRASSLARRAGWVMFFMVLLAGAAAAAGWFAYDFHQRGDERYIALALAGAGALLATILLISPYRKLRREVGELENSIVENKGVCREMMEPLNRLYTWDMPVKLIEQTVPRLQFDAFFTAARLEDLKRLFGWDDSFNEGKSILFAQSGVINGNPFAIGEYLEMEWGEKTYYGHKRISWTEYETDSKGHRRAVHRSETLTASVTKPMPEYFTGKVLVYGNDAAPNLSFTREPSGLTEGAFAALRKWHKRRELEKFSRNLTDSSNYTMMANKEFETLFATKDRDNEVEFRLLFTPLAQRQMLELVKDRTVGFGDDFAMTKHRKINIVRAEHLDGFTLDTDPAQFWDWDYDAAWMYFYTFNAGYFKHVYFAFAPLLAIPLYQQTRTHEEIWKGVLPTAPAAFWEHEATANYHGEDDFKHPQCITRSILKTRVVARDEATGTSEVAVTAQGYKGVKRIETKSVRGGDGKWHNVDVEWIEYLPVERTSAMMVAEGVEPEARDGAKELRAVLRRSIYSYLAAGREL